MPRYRDAAKVDLDTFVSTLVTELQKSPQPRPANPFASTDGTPVIFETPTGLGERFRVTVVWDDWGGLPLEDRNKVIMEAYRQVLGPASVNVSLTLGLTRSQYEKMQTTFGQLTGN